MFFRWRNYLFSICLACFCTWVATKKGGENVPCDDLLLGQYFCPEPDVDSSTQAAVGCTVNHTVEVKCEAAAIDEDGKNITQCLQNMSCRYTRSGHPYGRPSDASASASISTSRSKKQQQHKHKQKEKHKRIKSTYFSSFHYRCKHEKMIFVLALVFMPALSNGHSYETALLLSVFLGMFGIDRFYLGYPAIGLLKFCTLGFFFVFHLVDIVLIATQVVGPADGSEYIIDYYGPRLTHISKNMDTFYKPEEH